MACDRTEAAGNRFPARTEEYVRAGSLRCLTVARPLGTNDNFILRVVFQENNTNSRAIASRADYIERLKRAKGYLCNRRRNRQLIANEH